MSTNYCEIITSETTENILERLQQFTIEEQPFFKPQGMCFLGKINSSKFNLITFNTPSIEIEFTVSSTSIRLKYETNPTLPLIQTLIYALGFPIAIALFFWGLLDKLVSVEGKIFLTFFLLFPFFVSKIFKYIFSNYFSKKNDLFLKELEQLLDVRIKHDSNQKVI